MVTSADTHFGACSARVWSNKMTKTVENFSHPHLKFQGISANLWWSRRHVGEVRAMPFWKAPQPKGVCLGLFISCPNKSGTNLLISAWVGWTSTSITFVLFVLPCSIRGKKSLTCLGSFEMKLIARSVGYGSQTNGCLKRSRAQMF